MDEEGVRIVAERLRASIADAPIEAENDLAVDITVSIGCATFSADHPFQSSGELMEEADRCLLAAKRSGRNRIVEPESPGDSSSAAMTG